MSKGWSEEKEGEISMSQRRRKLLLGYNCDKDGNVIGNIRDGSLECIIMDIDSLGWQTVKFRNLANVEKNHNTNFIVEQDGSLSFVPNASIPDRFPRFYRGKFLQPNGSMPLANAALLGTIRKPYGELVGYKVYSCLDKSIHDLILCGTKGEYFRGLVADKVRSMLFSNAEWIQNNVSGFFWNEDCYPVFKVQSKNN